MNIGDFTELVSRFARILFPLALGIGFAMIIKAGYGLMTSEGDPRKLKESWGDLIAALVGILFVVLSGVIINIIIGAILN